MKKNIVRRIAASFAFLTILSGILYISFYVLKIKNEDGVTPMQDLYAQKRNTCDVLMLGSSHAGTNLSPETLWEEYGISSYCLWGSMQPLWNSYYFLEEALKTQKPKVVVLEALSVSYALEYQDLARQETNTVGMRFSPTKVKAVMASAPPDRWLDILLEFPLYHNRIEELSRDDFQHFPWTPGRINYKGNMTLQGTDGLAVFQEQLPDITTSLYPKQEEYLRKIIELCQQEGIELMFIKTPFPAKPQDLEKFWGPFNQMKKIGEENGVPFLDCNRMIDEMGILPEDVSPDGSHLNQSGAQKTSKALGAYLKEHYDLPDHRGDPRYDSWNAAVEKQKERLSDDLSEEN